MKGTKAAQTALSFRPILNEAAFQRHSYGVCDELMKRGKKSEIQTIKSMVNEGKQRLESQKVWVLRYGLDV